MIHADSTVAYFKEFSLSIVITLRIIKQSFCYTLSRKTFLSDRTTNYVNHGGGEYDVEKHIEFPDIIFYS